MMKTPREVLHYLFYSAKVAASNSFESRADPRTIATAMKQAAELALKELDAMQKPKEAA